MKKAFIILTLITLSACGNVTTSSSFSPEQRLQNTENEMAKAGLSFAPDNSIVSCESVYKSVCQNKVSLLREYINTLLNNFGSEQNMPQAFQQRVTGANACIDKLNSALNATSAASCHR